MCKSYDKNVIPLCGEMADWKNTKQEATSARIYPTVGCMSCQRWDICPIDLQVGKSRRPNVTKISMLIATTCCCFLQEVRALWPLHKLNLFANWWTNSANWWTNSSNWVPYHNDEVSIHLWKRFKHFIAELCGRWPPQHVNNKVSGANYVVV